MVLHNFNISFYYKKMLTRLIMTLLQINKAKKNYRTTKYIKKWFGECNFILYFSTQNTCGTIIQ